MVSPIVGVGTRKYLGPVRRVADPPLLVTCPVDKVIQCWTNFWLDSNARYNACLPILL